MMKNLSFKIELPDFVPDKAPTTLTTYEPNAADWIDKASNFLPEQISYEAALAWVCFRNLDLCSSIEEQAPISSSRLIILLAIQSAKRTDGSSSILPIKVSSIAAAEDELLHAVRLNKLIVSGNAEHNNVEPEYIPSLHLPGLVLIELNRRRAAQSSVGIWTSLRFAREKIFGRWPIKPEQAFDKFVLTEKEAYQAVAATAKLNETQVVEILSNEFKRRRIDQVRFGQPEAEALIKSIDRQFDRDMIRKCLASVTGRRGGGRPPKNARN